jgi:hypothetical protein
MKGFFVGPSSMKNNTFVGCTIRCEACGGVSDVIEGTFDHIGDSIKVRRAPQRTHDILHALQRAVSLVESGEDEESVIAELEKASPEFAKMVRTAAVKGGPGSVMLLLLFLISRCDGTLDWNQLADQGYFYMTGNAPYSETQPPASDPTPHEQKLDPKQHRPHQQKHQARKQHQQSAQQKRPAPSKPKR